MRWSSRATTWGSGRRSTRSTNSAPLDVLGVPLGLAAAGLEVARRRVVPAVVHRHDPARLAAALQPAADLDVRVVALVASLVVELPALPHLHGVRRNRGAELDALAGAEGVHPGHELQDLALLDL